MCPPVRKAGVSDPEVAVRSSEIPGSGRPLYNLAPKREPRPISKPLRRANRSPKRGFGRRKEGALCLIG